MGDLEWVGGGRADQPDREQDLRRTRLTRTKPTLLKKGGLGRVDAERAKDD